MALAVVVMCWPGFSLRWGDCFGVGIRCSYVFIFFLRCLQSIHLLSCLKMECMVLVPFPVVILILSYFLTFTDS